MRFPACAVVFCLLAVPWSGCDRAERAAAPAAGAPNIIVVVWDTVRADRLGLYGYARPTTPFLDAWAREARVFDDCVSPAPYTVASHGSLFTGLLPSEHGATNAHPFLDDRHATLAELLRSAGYQTYLFSANPHISRVENFHQGFDAVEHPWDEAYRDEALRIVAGKITADDVSTELSAKIRAGRPESGWDIKAAGELARRGTMSWLSRRDPERPFFVFLNYMEAHRPWIPPASYRRRMMGPEQVEQSYRIDRSWVPLWSYSFGLRDYAADELEVMSATYDACVAELDDLLRDLIGSLRSAGALENTVVVVTSDHGEHLGEHHLLGHQFSLYEPLLRVPLVVRDERRFAPGRDPRPVMSHDLFPTLLEIAGVDVPAGTHAVSLRSPIDGRVRLSEYVGVFRDAFAAIEPGHPGWDKSPWLREIRALYRDDRKLIRWSDGARELYNLREDPLETSGRSAAEEARVRELEAALAVLAAELRRGPADALGPGTMSEEHRELLRSLGYVHGGTEGSQVP
jgi:arylsulfatase A-like enzyme